MYSTERPSLIDIRENQLRRTTLKKSTSATGDLDIDQSYSNRIYRWTRRNTPVISNHFWSFCLRYKQYFPKWAKTLGKRVIWGKAKEPEVTPDEAPQIFHSSFIHPEQLIKSLNTHLIQYFTGFAIESSDNPEVTIIIPVHNNISITVNLLSRLRDNRENVAFEIIIVDDASTDSTSLVLPKIRGISVVSLPENLGYLGATNSGLQYSKGKYVCLLNNDTLPEEGWLTALHDSMIADPSVAICGSMLIDSSEKISEAGSQIFNSRTIWNLGRGNSRYNPMYLFNREVDYCSAAALLVESEFLQAAGGFDTRFMPAYFEDTDLCLQAWSKGRRVVYVHNSVVFHIEGASHGTDVKTGVKRYQITNAKKFWIKWKDNFKTSWPHDEQQRLEYSRNSLGIIIFFDDGISDPTSASGARRAHNLINSIRNSGYHVVVIPIQPLVSHEMLNRYRLAGIEVYPSYESALENLRFRDNRLKAIWLSRITVADKLWTKIAADFHGLPIIFDTVDLHFLRDRRAIENSTSKKSIYSDPELESRELAYMRAASAVVLVSEAEKTLLRHMGETFEPFVLFDSFDLEEIANSNLKRQSILFVGNFAHDPNADGLSWFIERVLPLISSNLLESIKVEVVGTGASQELVSLMEQNGVTYHGWQQSIVEFYERARISIAPLLFGAGVKGKIIESYAFSVPVVSTSVGVEGTGLRHMQEIICADTPLEFAKGIELFFSDDTLWRSLSDKGSARVIEIFGSKAFDSKLSEIISHALNYTK